MINLIFFFKPLSDMLWEYKQLNVILGIMVTILFFFESYQKKLKFNLISKLAAVLVLLFTFSLYRNTSISSIIVYLKLCTAFILFLYAANIKTIKVSYKSFMIPSVIIVALNFLLLITGNGYQKWGMANTFVGVYFYKTDICIAFFIAAVFLRKPLTASLNKVRTHLKLLSLMYIFIITPIVFILANARIFIFIYMFFITHLVYESNLIRANKINRWLKIVFVITISSYVFVNFAQSDFFKNNNYIWFEQKEGTYYNAAATQGRSEIWDALLVKFFNSSNNEKYLGIDLESDYVQINNYHLASHNSYLSILIYTGYIGLSAFILLLAAFIIRATYIFFLIKKSYLAVHPDWLFVYHTSVMLFVFFIIISVTTQAIVFTQTTWYVFFFMGLLFNGIYKKENIVLINKCNN